MYFSLRIEDLENYWTYSSERFGASMTASSSSEKASPAFARTQFFFCGVKLCSSKFFCACFIRDNSLLHFLVVSSYPENLPGTYDAIVQSVYHVENISTSETHLALFWLFVVKMCSEK